MRLSSDPGDDPGRSPQDLVNRWGMGTGTYSKSVTFLSSVTGLKATTFFLSPITQAESPELANTRPGRGTQPTMATSPGAEWPSQEQQGLLSATSLPPPTPPRDPQPSAHPCGRPPAASPTSTAPPSLPAWSHSCGQRGLGLLPGGREMVMSSPPGSWGQWLPVWPHPPYLLEVAQDINPAVEDTFALGGVEVVEELCGVVLVALLVAGRAEGRDWGGYSLIWHPQGVPPCSPKHLFFCCFVVLRPRAPARLPSRTLGPGWGWQQRHLAQDCPPG